LKQKTKKKDKARLAEVHDEPCCVCRKFGEVQMSPTTAHHCIHDRHGTEKRPDADTIPLCDGHHQGLFDTSKLAIHKAPQQWRDRYGADFDYLPNPEARTK
jgi:hypothetical protein